MAPITKDFLKSAGIFCLFLLLQVLIPVLALPLSLLPLFDGAQFSLLGMETAAFKITIPAMAFAFCAVQLGYVALLHFTRLAKIRLRGGKSANFGFSGFPIFHFTGAFLVMAIGLQLLLAPLNLNDGNSTALFRQLTTNIWGLLSVIVVGTLAEELTFRAGILQLTRKHLGNIGAVVLSSLLFALVHGNWFQVVPAFILGLALGYLYLRTDNLRLSWAAHLANNTFAVLSLRYAEIENFGQDWPLAQQLGVGALLFVLGTLGLVMRGSMVKRLFGHSKV